MSTRFIHILVYDVEKNNTINLNGFAVWIDGNALDGEATASPKIPHLFFFPWDPSLYASGLHTIKVSYSTGVRSCTYSHAFTTRPLTIRAVVATNRTMAYSKIQDAMEPGNNVGGYVLSYTFVIVMMVISYVLSAVLAVFIILCRQTVKRIYPYPMPSTFEGRYHVYHFLFRRSVDQKFPYFMRSFAFMASDKYVSRFFIVSLIWETVGFWAVGKFPKEFGMQSLWGVLFIPATRLGHYSLWLDLYLWHVIFLLLFYIPLILYYCSFMIPHGMTPEATSLSRTLRMICQCICFIYFVGVFLCVKVLAFWMSFDKATLFLSPVWFWIPFVNAGLMVREIVFEHHYNRRGLMIKSKYGAMDTSLLKTENKEDSGETKPADKPVASEVEVVRVRKEGSAPVRQDSSTPISESVSEPHQAEENPSSPVGVSS